MKTIAVAIVSACLMTVSYHYMFCSSDSDRNRMLRNDGDRPVMHTFFSQLQPNPHDSRQTTAGMTADAHTDMIRVWEESWQLAGWDTKVLTVEDAKQHPNYSFWDPTIQSFKMSEYDKFCFYRWIAMAAVGGGWMSGESYSFVFTHCQSSSAYVFACKDYDTVPLHNFTYHGLELPSNGSFTCYGVFVPALLSGNASEWQRLIHLMVDYADKHTPRSITPATGSKANDIATPSDMMSLLGLMKEDPNNFISRNEVIGSYDTKAEWTKEFCQKTFPTTMRAIHFSHYFVHDVWIPNHPGQTLDDRGAIAKSWIQDWLRACEREHYNSDVISVTTTIA